MSADLVVGIATRIAPEQSICRADVFPGAGRRSRVWLAIRIWVGRIAYVLRSVRRASGPRLSLRRIMALLAVSRVCAERPARSKAARQGGDELTADRVLPAWGNPGGEPEYDVIDALAGQRRDPVRAVSEVAGDD